MATDVLALPVEPFFLTRAQAQQYTGLSGHILDGARSRGELPFYQVGKRIVRFKKTDLVDWLDRYCVRIALGTIGSATESAEG